MSPLVKVDVFPVQISSIDPITSGELRFLTRILSSFILITEYANEIATVRGNPSGTATMITQIQRVTISQTALIALVVFISNTIRERINLTTLAMKMNMAAYNPHLVKVPAKFSSLIYRGVFEVVSSFSSKTPLLLFFPTHVTTAFPVPDTIKDYESKNGSGDSL
jgi:hypothetical protein